MNILLTGASGFIGRNIAAMLQREGHRVRPISRRHGVDFRQMTRPDDWHPHLDGIDAAINCVGIIAQTARQSFDVLHHTAPEALFKACAERGIRRIVQVSALGADTTAFSAYHLSKRAADAALRELNADWLILRPSLIYGRGGSSADFFLKLARWPLLPVIGAGRQILQPVHIVDVVAAVRQALTTPRVRQSIDLVGPEEIPFGDWLQRLRAAQDLPRGRLLDVPVPLAKLGFALASRFHPLFQPDNLRMLLTGYQADPVPFRDFLGRPPLAYAPHLVFTDAKELSS